MGLSSEARLSSCAVWGWGLTLRDTSIEPDVLELETLDPELLASIDPRAAADSLGGAEAFPDLRLFKRVPKIIDSFVIKLRMPPMKLARKVRRGATRWVSNCRLSGRKMLDSLFDTTGRQVVALDEDIVVAIDTSEIDLHGRGVPDDAGPLRSSFARGYLLQLAVAVTLSGQCLGVLDAFAWTRSWNLRKSDHRSRKKADKESSKWDRCIKHVMLRLKVLGFRGMTWFLEDREADDFEHYATQKRQGRRLIVRHDFRGRPRKILSTIVSNDAPKPGRGRPRKRERWIPLLQKLGALRFLGSYQIPVDSRMTDKARGTTHQVRIATVSYRFCNIVMKPALLYKKSDYRDGLPLGVVEVVERNPPKGVEPLHWILISLQEIADEQQALSTISKYKLRWKVEDYIKVGKSGCRLEAQQVDSLASFKRLMAVALATANQIVQIVGAARETPGRSAKELVDDRTLQALKETAHYHEVVWPRGRVTIGQVVKVVAQIGGYEKRKDRQPGWQVIYRGWARFEEHRAIVEHAQRRRAQRRKSAPADKTD